MESEIEAQDFLLEQHITSCLTLHHTTLSLLEDLTHSTLHKHTPSSDSDSLTLTSTSLSKAICKTLRKRLQVMGTGRDLRLEVDGNEKEFEWVVKGVSGVLGDLEVGFGGRRVRRRWVLGVVRVVGGVTGLVVVEKAVLGMKEVLEILVSCVYASGVVFLNCKICSGGVKMPLRRESNMRSLEFCNCSFLQNGYSPDLLSSHICLLQSILVTTWLKKLKKIKFASCELPGELSSDLLNKIYQRGICFRNFRR
ncbi:unnamed protein product [Moneuplotes crassus]|uniref:Uncharacterized protein n=1 Tax=Euplotes crassus TaxID=5936 RepID=A0AAD1XW07_EUPCR|nr:unnamed protein product [Moneuplotes crassus]